MILALLLVVIGLVGLIFSADFFVKGAISISKRFGLSDMLIGTTVVAIGTSAPELFINLSAAKNAAGDIVISNIIGSNIVNLCIGLGLTCLFRPILTPDRKALVNVGIGLVPVVALLIYINCVDQAYISRWMGAGLTIGFIGFMLYNLDSMADEPVENCGRNPILSVIYLLVGGVGLWFCGNLVVDHAIKLATELGIPQNVIGATIVAAGGSLPEVAACVASARMGRTSVALGNVIGSQAFNLLGVLGVTSLSFPFIFSNIFTIDCTVLVVITSYLVFKFLSKTGSVGRGSGILFITVYILFLTYLAIYSINQPT